MPHRIDRRVVAEAVLGEDIEGPCSLADDAERRRPVADDRLANDLLQGVLALANVVVELGRRQVVNALMVPAVAGDLVASEADGADEIGLLASELADKEEGGALIVPLKLIENPVRRR